MSEEWNVPKLMDVITAAAPDRDMIVWEGDRRTFAEVAERTKRLAAYLRDSGLGVTTERADLERWECGQSRIALIQSNCPQYVESMIGAYRARAVPYNVNHHYTATEIAALLSKIGVDAVIYHRRLGHLLAEVNRLADLVLIDIDDDSGVEPLQASVEYEQALSLGDVGVPLPEPSADDLYLVCTGGTTGQPKGVLWRQADIYVSGMHGMDGASPETIASIAANPIGTWFAAPPLMHAAAQWTLFAGLALGATAVLHDDSRPFDPKVLLETIERERATLISLVGDAYVRPIVEELRRHPYDLSSLVRIGVGGAATSPALKAELLNFAPQATVADGYGSSETGGMAFGENRKDRPVDTWALSAGAVVLAEDKSRCLEPGEDEVGWTARRGRVPLGYLDDPAATQRTFPLIDGVRYSVPGDRARLLPDGTIAMLGRDSLVVNTGGEKVFVEEVEEVVRRHPDVADALVVGRPSDRFGEEVVALVQLRGTVGPTPASLRDFVGQSLARFKAPRALLICEKVQRHASGKGDYSWARQAALQAEGIQ